MNSVNLVGRICADPELKKFGKGKNAGVRTRITVALYDGTDSDGEKRTQFIPVSLWGKTAEMVCKYCTKGDMVAISGRIIQNNYEDDEGEMHYSFEVVGSMVELTGKSSKSEKDEKKKSSKKSSKSKKDEKKKSSKKSRKDYDEDDEEDEEDWDEEDE